MGKKPHGGGEPTIPTDQIIKAVQNPQKGKKAKGNRRPPLWRRGGGIGKRAVWVEKYGRYVVGRVD